MQGHESAPLGVTRRVLNAVKSGADRSTNNIYDFLTPNALQRRIALFSTVLSLKNDIAVAFKRGVVYFMNDQLEEALVDLQNSIKWSTDKYEFVDHTSYYYLGMVHNRLANYSAAIDAYTEAVNGFVEKDVHKRRLERVKDKLRKKKRELSRNAHHISESIITKLSIHDSLHVIEKQKEREKIEDELDAIFATPIGKSDILNNRGLALLNVGSFEEAINDLKAAGESQHHYIYNLGLAYYYGGNTSQAKECFSKAIQMANMVPVIYRINAACNYDRLGREKEARESRELVLQIEPERNVYPFHFKLLPDSVFVHVLSFVDYRSLVNVALSCRTLHKFVYSPELWSSIRLFGWYKSNLFQKIYERGNGFVKEINAKYVDLQVIQEMTDKIQGQRITSLCYYYIAETWPKEVFQKFLDNNDVAKLERLEIVISLIPELPILDDQYLSHLVSLTLIDIPSLTYDRFKEILWKCKKTLQHLFVAKMSFMLDNNEISYIASLCPNLKVIVTSNPVMELMDKIDRVKVVSIDTTDVVVNPQHGKILFIRE